LICTVESLTGTWLDVTAGERDDPPSSPAYGELEFVRPQFVFEREYGQFRNWWARDQRIVGNAFSLLMYLVSHQRTFRITQQKARRDLGLGRDAFLAARRKLESAGFLSPIERRYPSGARDGSGRPVGGHRYIIYSVNDPSPPQPEAVSDQLKASTEYPPRLSHRPSTENPSPDSPPLKKTTIQENQDSSFKDELGEMGVNLNHLRSRLIACGIATTDRLDLNQAAKDILTSSRGPVSDPISYIVTSVQRQPARWERPIADSKAGAPTGVTESQNGTNPNIHIHRYIGTWHEICAICNEERPGWRIDRDADDQLPRHQRNGMK
jgi:hypothetical protein